MKLTAPVYTIEDGNFVIHYRGGSFNSALNWTCGSWVDVQYGIVRSVLKRHSVILTTTDLIAHDDYLANLDKTQTIVLVYGGYLGSTPSKRRLLKAQEKLKAAGIKTRYFASLETATRYIARLGEVA